MKKTVEKKIAKDGAKIFYVDGKRVSRKVALDVATEIKSADKIDATNSNVGEKVFVEYYTETMHYDRANLSADETNELVAELKKFVVPKKIRRNGNNFSVTVNAGSKKEQQVEDLFISYGVNYKRRVCTQNIKTNPIANPDGYAISNDAFAIAVNAEIDNANAAIIKKRDDAKKDYYELKAIVNVAEKEAESTERLRNRCKDGSPKAQWN